MDPVMKIQNDLDEKINILRGTMETLEGRDEKLEDLITKSEVLNDQSKVFHKIAKKTNSCSSCCCSIM